VLSPLSTPPLSGCAPCSSLDSDGGSTHTGDSRKARRHTMRERSRPARDSEFEVPKISFPEGGVVMGGEGRGDRMR
jgi:hypothetical protein